jgi:hypothetical protein
LPASPWRLKTTPTMQRITPGTANFHMGSSFGFEV